ncbi:hypothetical protein IDJ77_16270 [Mucilaginibacter sp. ZT4R22]|uniref:Uncharacterized protein n=1 Tax=Mucilaginibacter pankratovii TaxID=2772110 RepID=A0ABR7WSU3_9SPHI|nr:hypothetical protein [Mucilaginibacter pankratovii]MBD1365371.1 hypothetical protein [Mucilaginibacter pankratovii]
MPTHNTFFKFRTPFDLSPHRYDIGRVFLSNRKLEDNFFLLKVYEIDGSEYEPFYSYQLEHNLKANPGKEEAFFNHVHDIVTNRIRHFKRQDPFSAKFAAGLEQTRKLEAFLAVLKTKDRWHKSEPLESVIGEKDRLIEEQQQRISELEAQLKQARELDANEKIVIANGYFGTFMDLLSQLQNLTVGDKRLATSQGQSPWYKMVAKYFAHGGEAISKETARNYFPATKGDKPSKYINIAEKDKLFQITSREKK